MGVFIQEESGLADVTKNPPDRALDANSGNSIANDIVTARISEIEDKISDITANQSTYNQISSFSIGTDKLNTNIEVGSVTIPPHSRGIVKASMEVSGGNNMQVEMGIAQPNAGAFPNSRGLYVTGNVVANTISLEHIEALQNNTDNPIRRSMYIRVSGTCRIYPIIEYYNFINV